MDFQCDRWRGLLDVLPILYASRSGDERTPAILGALSGGFGPLRARSTLTHTRDNKHRYSYRFRLHSRQFLYGIESPQQVYWVRKAELGMSLKSPWFVCLRTIVRCQQQQFPPPPFEAAPTARYCYRRGKIYAGDVMLPFVLLERRSDSPTTSEGISKLTYDTPSWLMITYEDEWPVRYIYLSLLATLNQWAAGTVITSSRFDVKPTLDPGELRRLLMVCYETTPHV